MAIYHLSVQVISRGQGRSCVAAAAYRAGVRLEDERQGLTQDYSRRGDVRETWIQAPEEAPAWVQDRQALWTAVDAAEKRKDAQTTREVNVALPRELTSEQQREVVREFVQAAFVERGMVADVAIHEGHNAQEPNPHAHMLLTTRTLTAEGFGPKNRDWNAKALLVTWRTQWEITCNEALEEARQPARIDARSLAKQGIDRLPTVHEGVAVRQMEKRGMATERGSINQVIRAHQTVVVDLEQVRQELAQVQAHQQWDVARAQAGWSPADRAEVLALEERLGRRVTKADVRQAAKRTAEDPSLVAEQAAQGVLRQAMQKLAKSRQQQGHYAWLVNRAGEALRTLQQEYRGMAGLWSRVRAAEPYQQLQQRVQQGNRALRWRERQHDVVTRRAERVNEAQQQVTVAQDAAQPAHKQLAKLQAWYHLPWSRTALQAAQQKQEQAGQRAPAREHDGPDLSR